MEDKAPTIRNKWLLLTALALGAVVVILYNYHIAAVRMEARGDNVVVLRYTRLMNPGEKIAEKEIEEVEIPRWVARGMANVVEKKDKEAILDKNVNQRVSKGDYVYWTHTTRDDGTRPSTLIAEGMVAFPVQINPLESPGTILRAGDRVTLIGRLNVEGQPEKSYVIVQAVKVLGVGGKGPEEVEGDPARRTAGDGGQRAYRSIMIEMLPDESVKLQDVLTHVKNNPRVLVRNPQAKIPADAGRVNPELAPLYEPKKIRTKTVTN
ncbi:MAG TPA: RcpC/CpaB family pilus assembly protein [Phycisphaerae bacterium]|nr:RcpC/CpaB family pilus assembly protein [Phycisphaerae bacterium]